MPNRKPPSHPPHLSWHPSQMPNRTIDSNSTACTSRCSMHFAERVRSECPSMPESTYPQNWVENYPPQRSRHQPPQSGPTHRCKLVAPTWPQSPLPAKTSDCIVVQHSHLEQRSTYLPPRPTIPQVSPVHFMSFSPRRTSCTDHRLIMPHSSQFATLHKTISSTHLKNNCFQLE